MTLAQRNIIATPEIGLLIYQTNSIPGLYVFPSTNWTPLAPARANVTLSNLSSHKTINQNLQPDSSLSINLGAPGSACKIQNAKRRTKCTPAKAEEFTL